MVGWSRDDPLSVPRRRIRCLIVIYAVNAINAVFETAIGSGRSIEYHHWIVYLNAGLTIQHRVLSSQSRSQEVVLPKEKYEEEVVNGVLLLLLL